MGAMQGSCRPFDPFLAFNPGKIDRPLRAAYEGVGLTASLTINILSVGDPAKGCRPARLPANPSAVIASFMLTPKETGCAEPLTDLDGLHRPDTHHGAGDGGIDFFHRPGRQDPVGSLRRSPRLSRPRNRPNRVRRGISGLHRFTSLTPCTSTT
jgi:hypothetical protein